MPAGRRVSLGPAAGIALALVAGFPAATRPALAGAFSDCPTTTARAEIDAVGAAMFDWYVDVMSGSPGGRGSGATVFDPVCPSSPAVDISLVPPIHGQILAIFLVPDYIAAVPQEDPWGNDYDYRLNVADPFSADLIAIRSAGSDGIFEDTPYDVRPTGGPADDLVFYNDAWIRDLPRLDPVSRQRVTTEQVREVGRALLSWYTDVVSCFAASADPWRAAGVADVDMNDYPPISAAELAELLSVPLLYTRCVPELDSWGTPYDYRVNLDVCHAGGHFGAIRSLGSDAIAEGEVYSPGTFPADERHRDIVWADGVMARQPDASGTAIFFDGFESADLWGYWSCGPGF